jgi:cysteine-rich repeat protein
VRLTTHTSVPSSVAALAALAALTGVGLCVAPAHAQERCSPDSACRYKKPNVLVVLDYSSSMVGFSERPAWFPPGQTETTRWEAQLDAVAFILHHDDGFFADSLRLGLARFAHDPFVHQQGTVLSTDVSFPPITDGFAVDVPFDDQDGEYHECRGSGVEAETAVLRTTPPPFIDVGLDPTKLMLTWTRGALRSAHELIERTRDSHEDESGEEDRSYHVVLMTDGDWTCPDAVGQACDEDPAPEAAVLRSDGIPVHVVAFGDAAMQPSLDEVALQGGTGKAIDATSPEGIVDALASVLDQIKRSVIVPECTASLPRLLLLMDGSSSMIDGDEPGETNWDKARYALAGNPDAPDPDDDGYVEPVLDRTLELDGRTVAIEDVVHVGMLSFAAETEQTLMVELGPCRRDNLAWAMDPATSCDAPGCDDPYAGYPIEWSLKNSDDDRDPPFVTTTQSFMPACNETSGSTSCVGSIPNTFTGQGLEAAAELLAQERMSEGSYRADDRTRYFVVLITDGRTSAGSSDVQAAIAQLVDSGVDVYVIGFGAPDDVDVDQLDQYAVWGNTGSAIVVDPTQPGGADALADALQAVVEGLDLDACCVLDDCSEQPEPKLPGAVCGDGLVSGDEVCDDGADNARYDHCAGTCDGPHLYCGDGRRDDPEQCDDGDDVDDDGCDRECHGIAAPPSGSDEDGGVAGWGSIPPWQPTAGQSGGTAGAGGPSSGNPNLDAGMHASGGSSSDCSCRTLGKTPANNRAARVLAALLLTVFLRLLRTRRPRRLVQNRLGASAPAGPD